MSKPNRKRRNKRKADQYKKPVVRRAKRKLSVDTVIDEPSVEDMVKKRTDIMLRVFDRMEREQINEVDAKIIARYATKDGIFSYAKDQEITDLADLKLEDLTELEFLAIIKRANHGINVVLEARHAYVSGPFYTNRGMRRRELTKERKRRGKKIPRPLTASAIIGNTRAKKAAKVAVGI